jgi:hypothetical protein
MMSDQVSPTGSVRKNAGKPESSNLDPRFIEMMAKLLTDVEKAGKYSKFNWAKGNYFSVPLDSLERHLSEIKKGNHIDNESLLPHAVHIAINAMFFDYYRRNFPEMDDLHFKDKK